jgi:hypothetical protein
LNFESKTHGTQVEDQKPKKSSRRSYRRRKNQKASKWHKKVVNQEKWQRRAKKSSKTQKLPLTLSMQALPLR